MWMPLSAVASLFVTYPFRGAVKSEPGGAVAVVQLQNVGKGDQALDDSVARVDNRDGKYDRYLLIPGDVVIQARGFRHPAALVQLDVPAISAPGLHLLRPDLEQITSSYLVWCLNHPKTQAAIAAVAQGTHAPFIAKQAMARVEIPVPPLATQHRVAEVDRLRQIERDLAARVAAARDSFVDGATWQAAAAGSEGSR
jgi:hypothetical protein